MPRGDKAVDPARQKRPAGAVDPGREQQAVGPRETEARAWPKVNKLHGGAKNIDARRKVPSGPVGGSGRKTNLSRSS